MNIKDIEKTSATKTQRAREIEDPRRLPPPRAISRDTPPPGDRLGEGWGESPSPGFGWGWGHRRG